MSMSIQGALAAPRDRKPTTGDDDVPIESTGPFPDVEADTSLLGHISSSAIGALVGGTFGAIGGLLVGGQIPKPVVGTTVGVGIALGGAALGAVLANRDYQESRQNIADAKVFRGAGRDTILVAQMEMSMFDENGDGELDVLGSVRETSATVPVAGEVSTNVDATNLLRDADEAGNADGTLTDTELARFMAREADANRNGRLTSVELQSFREQHPVTTDGKVHYGQ